MRFSKMRGTNMPPLRGSAYLTREGFAATDMSPRWGSASCVNSNSFSVTGMSPFRDSVTCMNNIFFDAIEMHPISNSFSINFILK